MRNLVFATAAIALCSSSLANAKKQEIVLYECSKEARLADWGRITVTRTFWGGPSGSGDLDAAWDFVYGPIKNPEMTGGWYNTDEVDGGFFYVSYATNDSSKYHIVVSACGGGTNGCDNASQFTSAPGRTSSGMEWRVIMALAHTPGKVYFRLVANTGEIVREDSVDLATLRLVRQTTQELFADTAAMANDFDKNCDKSIPIANCGARGPCGR